MTREKTDICKTCGHENGENKARCPECRLIRHRITERARRVRIRNTKSDVNALSIAFLAGKLTKRVSA